MTRVRFALLSCGAISTAMGACSGGDNNANDGGADATQQGDATVDAPGGEGSSNDAGPDGGGGGCPTYAGSAELCKALVAHCGACGNKNITACEIANFTTVCNALAPAYSQAFASAETACETQCTLAPCIKAQLADASITNAQQKLASDYCAQCGDSGACVGQIESQLNLVYYSDTLANAIDTSCKPDAAGQCSGFTTCMTNVYRAMTASVCSDASTD